MLKMLFSALISFLVTFYVVPVLSAVAYKLGIVDIPDGRIKNHAHSTPYLGGLAVYIGFIIGLALVYPLDNTLFSLLIGSTILLFVGLIDDIVVMQPYQKLFGQILAALCFLKGGLFLHEQFFSDMWYLGLLLSVLWVLVLVNAFNLVDIMDGLATTIALGTTCSFLVIALLLGNTVVVLLLTSCIGALLAFLWYNRPVARMYLGDAGSLFIGGFLSAIPFLLSWGNHNTYGFITPLIILAIPLIEVTTLIIIRSYKGIPFYKPSPDHFAHYLRRAGWSIPAVLIYLVCVQILLLVIALLFLFNCISLPLLLVIGGMSLSFWYMVLAYQNLQRWTR